jgi:sugar transferase (PEP-CTERM/EpsH1 system associated)
MSGAARCGEVLFPCHRLPYPPNKGDKIRSFHWLQALARRYGVHLGCFVDDPDDWRHEAAVRQLCASTCLVELDPRLARLRSVRALLEGQPLTLRYFHDRRLLRWVDALLDEKRPERIVVYSSGAARYACGPAARRTRRLLDLCDLDSEKWREYARRARGPMRWVYDREARTLAAREREWIGEFDATLLSSEAERDLLRRQIGAEAEQVDVVGNGVDAAYFDPGLPIEAPSADTGPTVVFTGAMDYLANVDAVTWFADAVWPRVLAAKADARFLIVGSRPHARVRALSERAGIVVTGTVPDVRPYLASASCVVAPLRVARGVQNKVLEALAMDRPVVATRGAVQGISVGRPIPGCVVADDPEGMAAEVGARLAAPLVSSGGRAFVLERFSWQSQTDRFLALVEGPA